MTDSPFDVVILGGGPAGSAAARLLAAAGRDVLILPGLPARRPSLAESLPPSCGKLLGALGVLDDVNEAGFVLARGNTVAWGGAPVRVEPFAGACGWQVVRRRFDDLLLSRARAAGAHVYDTAAATNVLLPADTETDECIVHWRGLTAAGTLRARWVLDCTGRAGILARRGQRRRDGAPATTALVGIWQNPDGWLLADDSHTIIESYDDGWAWSVPVAPGARYIAVMIDPRRTRVTRAGGANALYRAELRKTKQMRRLLHGAVARITPWACSAATYDAASYTAPGALLVGDAGSFLDPLSSAGVKKALASAHLAAIVVHTSLQRPSMSEAARALFDERERTAHAHYSALAARHYGEAAAHHGQSFWTARAASAARSDHAGDDVGIEHDPRVRAAFDVLRTDRRARLRPASGVTHVQRPTVIGTEVVLADHLVSPSARAGVRVFRGVDLPALVAIAAEHDDVGELFEAYGRIRPAVNLPDFVGAVSALVALGMLERTGTAEPATLEMQ